MDEEEFFNLSYTGNFIADLTITTFDGTVDLYECRACRALTRNPELHIDWHKENEL